MITAICTIAGTILGATITSIILNRRHPDGHYIDGLEDLDDELADLTHTHTIGDGHTHPDHDCPRCGLDHPPIDPETLGAATAVTTWLTPAIEALDEQPFTTITCMPTPSGTLVTIAGHPDAYPDMADLAAVLTETADIIHHQQGNLNENVHRLRNLWDRQR